MKTQQAPHKIAIVMALSLTALLHGCSSTPADDVPLGADGGGGRSGGNVQVIPGSGGASFSGSDGGGYRGDGALGSPDDPNSPLYQRIVYFDYDSSALSPESQAIVSNHARYLAGNPRASISLEGHTDERGTREYNLALGEQRALSVADLMMLQGAAGNQIQTLTYGEERPADMGTGEAAWSANRRVEIVYLSQ